MPAAKSTRKTTTKSGSLKGILFKDSLSNIAQPEEVNVSKMISPVASIKVIGCGGA